MAQATDEPSTLPDAADIALAASALANVPPIKLLEVFSILLTAIAGNLADAAIAIEEELRRRSEPATTSALLRRRIAEIDAALGSSDISELSLDHRVQLREERARLAELIEGVS